MSTNAPPEYGRRFAALQLLALVFLAEKNWRYGIGLNWIVGTAVAVLGIVVFLFPDVLGVVTGAGAPVMTSGI